MASVLQCPCTLAVHFPSEIYRSTGSSQVLPELVKSLDLPNVRGIQFMPNGVVRVTYKEPAQCDAAHAGGILFRGTVLRTTPVDSRTRLVYVRDLPLEVPDDGLQVYLRAFGVVHSCSRQTYPGMPDVSTGTRMVKVTLAKDLPSFARVSGYDVRFWYQGQPQACPVCRSYGHRVKDCPLNGLCRRCRQPGHMARECPSRRAPVPAASTVPDPVAGADPSASEDEADPDYVISSASESGSCSGDEEVLRSASTTVPTSRKRSAPSVDDSSVDLRDNELSSPGTPESASAVDVPVPDSFRDPPGTPVSASAVVVPDGTPAASAVPVSSESSSPKPKRRMPRPPAVASSLVKFFSSKSTPVKESAAVESVPVPVRSSPVPDKSAPIETVPAVSDPPESPPVPDKSAPTESVPVPVKSPPRSFWEASRRSGFGRVLDDGCGGTFYFDFGRLTRSIQVGSSSFEYDRFVKYVHHGFGKNVGPDYCDVLPAGPPAKFPGQK